MKDEKKTKTTSSNPKSQNTRYPPASQARALRAGKIRDTKYKIRNTKITSFTDLDAWKQAHKLVLKIYQTTKKFPRDERYGLVDQIRRSAISISSNIAEGFSRQGKKEKLQFYFTAKGSLTELQNQLLIARDVGYLEKEVFNEIAQSTIDVHKLINGLIKSATQYTKPDTKYEILNTKY